MAEIIPVIFGGVPDSYDVARAFHECYGVKSHVFDTRSIPVINHSSLITAHVVENLKSPDAVASEVGHIASRHEGAALILYGCTNEYAALITDARKRGLLPPMCVSPLPDARCYNILKDKKEFFLLCDKYGVPHNDGAAIPGTRHILTTYSDRRGRVRMACLCDVVLMGRTPTALITASDTELTSRIRRVLDGERYVGLCSFDLFRDRKSGQFLVRGAELCRSYGSSYMTAAGANVAEFIVRDLIFGEDLPYFETDREIFWHCIPKSKVRRHIRNTETSERVRYLCRTHSCESTPYLGCDRKYNPLRALRIAGMLLRERTAH